MRVPHSFILGTEETLVQVSIVRGEPPPGRNITNGSQILVLGPMRAAGIIINTLDDFDLQQVSLLEGTVLLDVGRLTRDGPYHQLRKMVPLPDVDIRRRISIIKANDEEAPYLPKEWIEEQQNKRIYLYTRGREGVDIWVKGQYLHFPAPTLTPKNVLGAGDTFGSAFLATYLAQGESVELACKAAIDQVCKLFEEKPLN
jgi:hypothetical protein